MSSPDAGSDPPEHDDDLLPDRTSDERDVGWGDDAADDRSADDERLLADRPPHWDDRG